MTKTNTRLLFSILLVFSTLLFYTGCVDTGVENIESSYDFYSQLSVANFVSGSGTATISFDSEVFGSAVAGAQTASTEIQSGSKKIAVSYTNATAYSSTISIDTEYKVRLYIVSDSSGQSLVKDLLRYTWQTQDSEEGEPLFPEDTTLIAIFNGSPDVSVDGVTISGGGTDTTITFESAVDFESKSEYIGIPATSTASYTVAILQDGVSVTSFSVSAAPQSRYTAVIYDYSASIKHSVFTDD